MTVRAANVASRHDSEQRDKVPRCLRMAPAAATRY